MTSIMLMGPSPTGRSAGEVGLSPSVPPLTRYRGALLGVAIGDALGRPAEGKRPEEVRRRYGWITEFIPWRGGKGYPQGRVTDDTQMTMCVAESILAHGDVQGADLAERFVAWLPHGRGKGRTCTIAVERLQAGYSWMESGIRSAGNGAAMRVAPVGLRHAGDLDRLRKAAFISALPTHADRTAIASAIIQAWGVAYLAHREPGTLDPSQMLSLIPSVVGDLPGTPWVTERKPGGRTLCIEERMAELAEMLELEPDQAFAHTRNGAFVLESLPAAWWSFLRSPEDPEQVVVTAANAGFDADTVASMAAALAGAYHGYGGFPRRWLRDVEYHAELLAMADRLHRIAELAAAHDRGADR